MADDNDSGDRNLGDIPGDISVDPLQEQVPGYLQAAFVGRNRPIARSVADASTRLRRNVGRSLLRANSAKMWDASR